MTDRQEGAAYIDDGRCAICNNVTLKTYIHGVSNEEEAFVCGDCMVDLHKATHTKLTTLQRVGILEAKTERIESKVDRQNPILQAILAVVLTVTGFLAGIVVALQI